MTFSYTKAPFLDVPAKSWMLTVTQKKMLPEAR